MIEKIIHKEQSAKVEGQTIEVRFQSLIENTQEGSGLISPGGTFVYLTPSVKIVLGYSVAELLGIDPVSLIHVDDRESFVIMMKELMHWPGESRRITCRMLHKNGEWRYLRTGISNKLHEKTVDAIIFNYEDITERIAFHEQLFRQVEITQATIALQEQERTALGKELHENISQMLASIRLHLNAYTSGGRIDESLIEKSTKIIGDSIDALRQLSKELAPPSLENFTLKESIEDLTTVLKLAPGSVRFKYRALKEDILPEALKIAIYRIVQQQISNIKMHAQANVVLISIQQSATTLKLRIADNGAGFDTGLMRKGKGFPDIVHRSVAFNGKLDIESSPGKGCSITVVFNLKQPPVKA